MTMDVLHLVVLAAAGLLGGIGITALGPGGVLPTIGLFLFSGLTPAGVAGTAIVTHVATGLLGTAAYARSGQLREAETRRCAAILAWIALVGAPLGVLLNTLVPSHGFGILLASAVAVSGILVWVRDARERRGDASAPGRVPAVRVAVVGLVVSVAAGLFGLGGPMLSVPLLVVSGMPVLAALAAAQAQSIVIASVGTVAYVAHGSVDWALAAVVGVPELAGVLIGWRIAHAVPAERLKYALVASLLVLGPYLAWHA
ncbi:MULTISPECIES: sulfite exporter TauE/SafE family protein [unclassified Streptomyces]|uniref:sulfite exporter TauE/SafE family protein n=1 Tax=unclassified Streptomyces TaxID=2593676 RepID=UPI002DD7D4E0|nr:sulfite exporter TauE/SafE family protein [Streptomyces sp. NBC_01257]WRZ69625.1 sulfite exporter TauE/SafE family protein [Streptomyces sp. NBC_01257]WSU63557.1 sulfite exporter TauE/SafE family protein [Streptomyces sp. NBC_01104]